MQTSYKHWASLAVWNSINIQDIINIIFDYHQTHGIPYKTGIRIWVEQVELKILEVAKVMETKDK